MKSDDRRRTAAIRPERRGVLTGGLGGLLSSNVTSSHSNDLIGLASKSHSICPCPECLECPAQAKLLSRHHLTSIRPLPNCMSSAIQRRASAKPCAVRLFGSATIDTDIWHGRQQCITPATSPAQDRSAQY